MKRRIVSALRSVKPKLRKPSERARAFLLALAGVVVFSVGVALIYVPAALILAGAGIACYALFVVELGPKR